MLGQEAAAWAIRHTPLNPRPQESHCSALAAEGRECACFAYWTPTSAGVPWPQWLARCDNTGLEKAEPARLTERLPGIQARAGGPPPGGWSRRLPKALSSLQDECH